MPLSSAVVGAVVGPRLFDLAARHCMAYAAGLGDRNPAYFDDTRPEGVVAPPMLGVRLDWPLRPLPGAAAPGMTREEARQGVHATQDMIFHRLARAGDRLSTSGIVVTVEQRRPGAYVVTRYDTVDAGGAPVLTVYYGSLFRGLVREGDDRGIDTPAPLPAHPHGAGAPRWTADVYVARGLPHIYTECADIWNPIHTERSVALAAGLPDIILHGTATLALAARELLNREAGSDPARLARVTCRFGAMVIPGGSIRISATAQTPVDGGRAVFFDVTNAEGGPAIRDGVAVIH